MVFISWFDLICYWGLVMDMIWSSWPPQWDWGALINHPIPTILPLLFVPSILNQPLYPLIHKDPCFSGGCIFTCFLLLLFPISYLSGKSIHTGGQSHLATASDPVPYKYICTGCLQIHLQCLNKYNCTGCLQIHLQCLNKYNCPGCLQIHLLL